MVFLDGGLTKFAQSKTIIMDKYETPLCLVVPVMMEATVMTLSDGFESTNEDYIPDTI